MLKDKNVVVGVTGGIAAYKACDIVSRLKKLRANVFVVMTKNATQFVAPLTFETLSGNAVVVDMFEKKLRYDVEHISLAKKADAFLIAPASCDFIGKIANGICDDMLTTTVMATKSKVFLCPSMNTAMYENKIFDENMKKLISCGYVVIPPASGNLACGDSGKGRLPEPEYIVDYLVSLLCKKSDYVGKKVLVTSGSTREKIDGVRFITNQSSGKMGCELAKAAQERGADVTLVSGYMSVEVPYGVKNINVATTDEMFSAVVSNVKDFDIIIKAAAPGDYKVKSFSEKKIKDVNPVLEFIKNADIAKAVGNIKGTRKLVVFSAETENLIENAKGKLLSKNADMVVANDVTMKGAGFDCDTNIVTIITKDDKVIESGLQSKSAIADRILDEILLL